MLLVKARNPADLATGPATDFVFLSFCRPSVYNVSADSTLTSSSAGCGRAEGRAIKNLYLFIILLHSLLIEIMQFNS